MFNAYQHEKQLTQAESISRAKEIYLKSLTNQEKIREKLVKKNRQRVQTRILQMSLDPVPISRKVYNLPFPELKGAEFFRHQPKNSQERILDAQYRNLWLDTVPLLPRQHEFRPRYKSKEIHSDMRFTPKDRYERVSDTWRSQHGTIESSWELGNKSGEMFPNTLRKSYYKTVESVALDARTKTGTLNLASLASGDETDRSLAQVAQDVMEKCKLKPLKSEINSTYQSRSASLPGR